MFIKLTNYHGDTDIYVNTNMICSFFRSESACRTYINYSASSQEGELSCDAVKETPEQIMELINNGR